MYSMLKISTAFLVSASLTGCIAGLPELNAENKTSAQGTAVGAASFAALGYAVDGKRGAVIGALVGSALGAWAAQEINRRKAQYVSAEDALNNEITLVESRIQQLYSSNQQLTQNIRSLGYYINQYTAQLKQGYQVHAQLNQQKTALQQNQQYAQQELSKVEQELQVAHAMYQEYSGQARRSQPQNVARWENDIRQLEQQKATLQANLTNLNNMSVAVGA